MAANVQRKACLKQIHSQYLQKPLQHYEPSCKMGGAVLQFVVKDEVEEEAGSFSPQLLYGDNSENEAIDPEEDRSILENALIAVIEERKDQIQEPVAREQPPLLEKFNLITAMGAMEEGDVVIGSDAELNLDSQVEWWLDKYRTRKPKTHSDHDNPPPKIVLGYKFAIFYPDLINRTETPTYTFETDGSNGETSILRFHAGPPYGNIAFRIVKKDWDKSHTKGFKSMFGGGICGFISTSDATPIAGDIEHFGEELLRDELLKRGALEDELFVEKLLFSVVSWTSLFLLLPYDFLILEGDPSFILETLLSYGAPLWALVPMKDAILDEIDVRESPVINTGRDQWAIRVCGCVLAIYAWENMHDDYTQMERQSNELSSTVPPLQLLLRFIVPTEECKSIVANGYQQRKDGSCHKNGHIFADAASSRFPSERNRSSKGGDHLDQMQVNDQQYQNKNTPRSDPYVPTAFPSTGV
ncbi:unnamed protein product [Dovyalis caffra]|uniref:Splicing factor Cactin C-terminal domain-containing protein n=1 Tax=Dovyalis caffra TaxID=77055 RepID=A0AAV1RB58_9ROSI|nr:unnamed protein product [Dovyalis caffra]